MQSGGQHGAGLEGQAGSSQLSFNFPRTELIKGLVPGLCQAREELAGPGVTADLPRPAPLLRFRSLYSYPHTTITGILLPDDACAEPISQPGSATGPVWLVTRLPPSGTRQRGAEPIIRQSSWP